MSEQTTVRGGHLLEGVRVLEFASVLAGPYAGMLLRLLGAEVVKVEAPPHGDAFRGFGSGASTHFSQFNAGKKSVFVDLRDERGVAAVRKLVAKADVILENSRPGRMEKLGLSEAVCHQINPDLVYVSMSGFGTQGPLAQRPAYDAIGQAMSGFMSVVTTSGPPSVGPAMGDMISGIIGASAALAGLAGRSAQGIGVTVETSMLEAIFCAIGDQFTQYLDTGEEPDRDLRAAQSQVYSLLCSDDAYVVLHLSNSPKFFANLAQAVGLPELVDDERFADYRSRMRFRPDLQVVLDDVFKTRTSEEWEKLLAEADVPCGRVLGMAEVVDHPHTEALQVLGPVEDDGLRRLRGPWRVGGERPQVPGAAPGPGEHTREILSEVLEGADLESLIADGVLVAWSDDGQI